MKEDYLRFILNKVTYTKEEFACFLYSSSFILFQSFSLTYNPKKTRILSLAWAYTCMLYILDLQFQLLLEELTSIGEDLSPTMLIKLE